MNKIKLYLINKPTADPLKLLTLATKLTYTEKFNAEDLEDVVENIEESERIIKNVLDMKHAGIFEHLNYTMIIQGASRSFLAQITRHRHFSFTSASQHYIDYSNFADFVVPIEILDDEDKVDFYIESCKEALTCYQVFQDMYNEKHEVARQMLPNAMRNNLMVTGNIRQWLSFINLRACGRNTSEIQYIAYKAWEILKQEVPEIFDYAGPDCVMEGHCTQKHMTCGKKFTFEKLAEKFKSLE